MDRAPSTPFRMVLTVFLTCVLSATALTFTYEATRGRIAAQEREMERRALAAVLAEGARFERLEDVDLEAAAAAAGDVSVAGIWSAFDDNDIFVGHAIRCAPRGYGGPIEMIVGLDRDGKVAGVNIITHDETPGLGTKIITEPWFLQQFIGWDAMEIQTAVRGYDTISGATKSADAIREGVVAASRIYEELLTGLESGDGEE